jgi:NADH-quinone oxidoreductase subunit N
MVFILPYLFFLFSFIILFTYYLVIYYRFFTTVREVTRTEGSANQFLASSSSFFIFFVLVFLSSMFAENFFFNLHPVFFSNFQFVFDSYNNFFDLVVSITSVILFVMFGYYFKYKNYKTEIFFLFLLILFGISIALHATDFLSFYLGLELQSLCFYILIAFSKTFRSIEAALKYFLLSVFSTILILFAISIFYALAGTLNYYEFYLAIYDNPDIFDDFYFLFAQFFMLVGFAFKIGSFPFQIWVPDIYQTAPLFSVTLLATISKFFGFFVIFKIFFFIFHYSISFYTTLHFMAILSIVYGTIGGLLQTNFRRLIGYSAITHTGYILISFSVNSLYGFAHALVYLCIYLILTVGVFVFLASVYHFKSFKVGPNKAVQFFEFVFIDDFRGIATRHWGLAVMISAFLFSYAGIPPFSGFFSKYLVIFTLIDATHYFSAIVVSFFSVISAYYYISVVKNIFAYNYNYFLPRYKTFEVDLVVSKEFSVFWCILFIFNIVAPLFLDDLLFYIYYIVVENF